MMFLLSIIILGGLALYIFIAQYVYRALKKELPQKKKYIAKIVLAVFILFPVYDIVITNILGVYYCLLASPHPKTKIEKKVEYPISIYWEDNVYPGFSKEDRELMIINYLDGVHLKIMALNGPENKKVYVYHTNQEEIKKIRQKIRGIENVITYNKAFAAEIMKTEKIYTKATMPKLNCTVTFNEIHLNAFARKFLYSDETKVIENKTNKVIAYNRRYMHFFYNIFPDFELGDRYYDPEPVCGERVAHLEYKVFDAYKWSDTHFGNHQRNLHEILTKRYIKGEK